MIRAVAFDLDDTLYPETQFVFGGYRAVAATVRRRHGFDIYAELADRFARGERGDLFTPVLRGHFDAVREEEIQELVRVYRTHRPELRPYDDVVPTFEALRAAGLPLALISDGRLDVQRRKLEATGLAPWFAAVVFPDQWGREFWKPHPRPFEECARLLRLTPPDLAYVGDNPAKDFSGARALGFRTVRIRRSDGLHRAVDADPAHDADVTIDHLDPARLMA